MFELIGGLFSLVFSLIGMALELAWGVIQFVFGLLGGIFSLILSLGGFLLAGALILVAVIRRRDYKNSRSQPYADNSPENQTYDVDKEEFTSFYDQYRTE